MLCFANKSVRSIYYTLRLEAALATPANPAEEAMLRSAWMAMRHCCRVIPYQSYEGTYSENSVPYSVQRGK